MKDGDKNQEALRLQIVRARDRLSPPRVTATDNQAA